MKIILPLAALGLLSTLFLISRSVDPTKAIAVNDIDLTQRAQEQGATNAAFAGVTTGGEQVRVEAATARPEPGEPRRINAETVSARIDLPAGTAIDITSDRAQVDQGELTANLEGDVRFRTTTGYDIRTERLEAQFDTLYAETPGPITGEGPPGELSAGRMVLRGGGETGQEGGDAHLLFTDGVKLVYTPPVDQE